MRKPKFPNHDEIDYDSCNLDVVGAAQNETPIIFSYSRAQALADGTLRDAGEIAKEAGFSVPVALTQAAWQNVVAVPEFALSETEEGRLWDVMDAMRWAGYRARNGVLEFEVNVTDRDAESETVSLRAVCGDGDDGELVITVMLRNED